MTKFGVHHSQFKKIAVHKGYFLTEYQREEKENKRKKNA